MLAANLKPFLRHNLNVLFVGLNPPIQSNTNGHYFSGKQSRFFYLLAKSGLIVCDLDKQCADIHVFRDTRFNYHQANYGVVDLICDHVETDSTKMQPKQQHVDQLIVKIRTYQPRIVCILHSKVRKALNHYRSPDLVKQLDYGACGSIVCDCPSLFFLNYFPNGNAISDSEKLRIFSEIKALL